MPSPEGERGGWPVKTLEKVNKVTFISSLGVAGVGVVAAPAIVAPALTFAAIDGVQLYAINRWRKGGNKKAAMKQSLNGEYKTNMASPKSNNLHTSGFFEQLTGQNSYDKAAAKEAKYGKNHSEVQFPTEMKAGVPSKSLV